MIESPSSSQTAMLLIVTAYARLTLTVHRSQVVVALYRNGLRKAPGRSGLEVRLHVRRGSIGSTVRVLDDEGNLPQDPVWR